VTGYQVVRNGVAVATVGSDATVYTDNSVAAATSYSYRVRGLDAEGNLSGDSNTVTLTTPDFAPPSAPTGLTATATATGTEIDLAWTASTDNVGVTAYQVMRDGSYLDSTAGTQYADTTVAPVTTHTYSMIALGCRREPLRGEQRSERHDAGHDRTGRAHQSVWGPHLGDQRQAHLVPGDRQRRRHGLRGRP